MTPFARKVYQAVLEIKPAQVRSYQWIAQRIGHPRSARAVGQALKNNPYPFIIPCHRVVRSDGDLGGYIFGRNAKSTLLNMERQSRHLVV